MINHAHRDGRIPNSAIQTSNLRSPHVETASRAVERSWSTLFWIYRFVYFLFSLFLTCFFETGLGCAEPAVLELIVFICVCVHLPVCALCACSTLGGQKGASDHLSEVTEGCDPPSPCCEPHLGPLQVQQVLLAVNPSLQLLNRNLIKEENQLRPLINSTTFPKTGRSTIGLIEGNE